MHQNPFKIIMTAFSQWKTSWNSPSNLTRGFRSFIYSVLKVPLAVNGG